MPQARGSAIVSGSKQASVVGRMSASKSLGRKVFKQDSGDLNAMSSSAKNPDRRSLELSGSSSPHRHMKRSSDPASPIGEVAHNLSSEDLFAEPIIKEGMLNQKDPKSVGSWGRRWFVLRSSSLMIYKDAASTKLLRKIPIKDVLTVAPISPSFSTPGRFCFHLVCASRSYFLRAPTNADTEAWLNHFSLLLNSRAVTIDPTLVLRDE